MVHFHFTSDNPGIVLVRSSCKLQEERRINLLKKEKQSWNPCDSTLPDIIVPDGLSLDRQWYLYEKIREFCPIDVRDMVCPRPIKQPPSSDEE